MHVRPAVAAIVAAGLTIAACHDDGASTTTSTVAELESASSTTPAPVTTLPLAEYDAGWTRLPDPPLSPRTGATTASVGSEIYVIGGSQHVCKAGDNCAPMGDTFRDGAAFDVDTGQWRTIADAPTAIPAGDTAVIGGDIYVLSFLNEDERSLLRYSTTGDEWAEIMDLPPALGVALEPYGGHLIVYGVAGMGHGDWRFDPTARTWTALPDDPHPMAQSRVLAETPAGLFLLSTGLDYVVTVSRFNGVVWSTVSDGFRKGYLRGVVGATAYFSPYAYAGAEGGIVDLATMSWTDVLPVPEGYNATATAVGLIADGGVWLTGQSGPVWDARADAWTEVVAVDDREWAALALHGERFFVFGGQDWSTVADDVDYPTTEPLLGDAWLWVPAEP
jgi:hypothetical protein